MQLQKKSWLIIVLMKLPFSPVDLVNLLALKCAKQTLPNLDLMFVIICDWY